MDAITATATPTDPLALLPAEIVLHALEFAPASTLASLTRVSRAWHDFIDVDHQNAIYSSPRKTNHPRGAKDFAFLSTTSSFSKYFDHVASWKDLCKRQTLLEKNWTAVEPMTKQSVIQVGHSPVWRFKPDFKRRFFLSTSHNGGLRATDMDTGHLIWSLPRDQVRPYAHLEYQDGTAVWDRYGNALEVWKTDYADGVRGEFRRVAVINHECETRGFQFSFDSLVVSSSEGEGFVYDMSQTPPVLKTHITLRQGAMGHVYQDADAVLFSMAEGGFDFYEKATGDFLGTLDGWGCVNYRHIKPPPPVEYASSSNHDPFKRHDRLSPIHLEFGHLPGVDLIPIEEDEWGAGMIDGGTFVGLSRGGRILVCPQWRKVLREANQLLGHLSPSKVARRYDEIMPILAENGFDPTMLSSIQIESLFHQLHSRLEELVLTAEDGAVIFRFANPNDDNISVASFETGAGVGSPEASEKMEIKQVNRLAPPPWTIIESKDDGASFDIGGWLAIQDNRFLCEMDGRIYIISLNANGDLYQGKPERASWSLSTAAKNLRNMGQSPVSFMGLYDDCIMSTFATLCRDSPAGVEDADNAISSIATKAIRTLSLAPDTSGTQSRRLWQLPNPHQAGPDYGRELRKLMDQIIEVGGEIEGIDGDMLVWHGPDKRQT